MRRQDIYQLTGYAEHCRSRSRESSSQLQCITCPKKSKPIAMTGIVFATPVYYLPEEEQADRDEDAATPGAGTARRTARTRENAMPKPKNAYVVIFTCAVTRALHLEVVTDMSTETFILAFRRFRRKGRHRIAESPTRTTARSRTNGASSQRRLSVDDLCV